MRILWVGNAPWSPSGYGEQANLFLPRLRALGHEFAIAANYGLQAATFKWEGFQVYPAPGHRDNSTLGIFYEHHDADLVICLNDAWVMKPDVWPDDVRVALWAPIDHYPIPPKVLAVLQHEKVRPIAMSRFGEEWMRRFKLDPLYVPHGVDTSLYYPQPEIKAHVRRELEIPEDAFLVGMVAANKGWNPHVPRKCFPQAMHAFAQFAREHEDAWMYVHAEAVAQPPGMDLDVLARTLKIDQGLPLERLKFPPDSIWHLGFPREQMANLYAAFDVLLNPSMGEGFGIPILEAQACGVPVITSNHSAMIELTQAGWLVDGDPWWDALQESFAFMPAIGSIREALEAAYETRYDSKLREAAAEFALEYDADLVTTRYWEPALDALAKPREVPPLNGKVSRQVRRAEARKKAKATV